MGTLHFLDYEIGNSDHRTTDEAVLARINEKMTPFHVYEGGFISQIYDITTKNHTVLIRIWLGIN